MSTEALELFLACHDRIRHFTAGLARIATLDDPWDARAPLAAQQCAHYFQVGLPLHGADEDHSLMPRLLQHAPPQTVVVALEKMHAEHLQMDQRLPALLAALAAIANKQSDAHSLSPYVPDFSSLMLGHLQMEEEIIFPYAQCLTADEQEAIAREIRARR
jgi:iron-sulfur cluster repair protein YtfE (RIC family)